MKKSTRNLLISAGCGIVYGSVVALLYSRSSSYKSANITGQTFISNVCFFTALAYGLFYVVAFMFRMGAFKRVSYLAQKRRARRNKTMPKYTTFDDYMKNRETSTYSLKIFWLPALVFLAVTVITAVL